MQLFKTILTRYGLQRMVQGAMQGLKINLTHMAVGDGGGNPTAPTMEQDKLVREIAGTRLPINRIVQNPDNPRQYSAEVALPIELAGFTMREAGIYDDAGALFAVASLPETYKPTEAEGAYSDAVVRLVFEVSDAEIVTMQIDPNVALATHMWVMNNVTVATLIPGGTARQVLRKRTNTDGDVEWADEGEVNVIVQTIEEQQALAANQTRLDLLFTTTDGLAVYIDGKRLPAAAGAGGWTRAPEDPDTRIVLGQAYAAGAKLIAVQNEPAGTQAPALERDRNLADVSDAAVARTNLDVYSKEEADRLSPAGLVAYYARSTAPAGWLKANGAAVSRTAYAALFAAIGTTFGPGDNFNTFNLPDLRGEFPRGWDDGRGIDAYRTFGTTQASQNLSHTHTGATNSAGSHTHSYLDGRPVPPPGGPQIQAGPNFTGVWEGTDSRTTGSAGTHAHTVSVDAAGGTEARPRNIALLACVKY
jgi:phage-related tail fiber protein